jgi:phage baseplate assembly protein W
MAATINDAQSEARLLGRGLSFPPRIGPDGRIAFSAGADNVRESIRVILSTERRERLMLPQFGGGLALYLFQPNIPSTHTLIEDRIRQALTRWEPRIELESVQVSAAPAEPREAIATVRYRLVATGASDRLDLTLRLTA